MPAAPRTSRGDSARRERELRRVEETIQAKETRLSEIEARLADPDLYRDGERTRELLAEYSNCERNWNRSGSVSRPCDGGPRTHAPCSVPQASERSRELEHPALVFVAMLEPGPIVSCAWHPPEIVAPARGFQLAAGTGAARAARPSPNG